MREGCMPARRGLSGCVPSLADLSQAVLGQRLRAQGAPHDCAADAAAAMRLAQHLLTQRAPGLQLEPPQQKVGATLALPLLLVPAACMPAPAECAASSTCPAACVCCMHARKERPSATVGSCICLHVGVTLAGIISSLTHIWHLS
jgi:hypothetical protein